MKPANLLIILFALNISTVSFSKEIGKILVGKEKFPLLLSTLDKDLVEIPFNKVTSLILEVDQRVALPMPKAIRFTSFDCRMPDHNHGMVTKPKIKEISQTQWQIDGFKLHMRGVWEFQLWIQTENEGEKIEYKIKLNY